MVKLKTDEGDKDALNPPDLAEKADQPQANKKERSQKTSLTKPLQNARRLFFSSLSSPGSMTEERRNNQTKPNERSQNNNGQADLELQDLSLLMKNQSLSDPGVHSGRRASSPGPQATSRHHDHVFSSSPLRDRKSSSSPRGAARMMTSSSAQRDRHRSSPLQQRREAIINEGKGSPRESDSAGDSEGERRHPTPVKQSSTTTAGGHKYPAGGKPGHRHGKQLLKSESLSSPRRHSKPIIGKNSMSTEETKKRLNAWKKMSKFRQLEN